MIVSGLNLTDNGDVQVNFGPASMVLSVDAAYEFQYQLAEFLADLERKEDELFGEQDQECNCEEAGHDNLLTLSHYRSTR